MAAVEAPGEAGEIGAGMLGADVMRGAGQGGLEVAKRGIHPCEWRPAGCLFARPRPDREMIATRGCHGRPAGEPVADDGAASGEARSRQRLDLVLAKAVDGQQLE
jgi:hypothetical protein